MNKWLPLVALFALQIGGCAYSTAMRRGHQASIDGDWRQAVTAYDAARQVRERPDAAAAWSDARDRASEEALDEALIAIGTGAYESAVSAIDYVDGLYDDHPGVFTLRRDCQDAMRQDIAAHTEMGNIRIAYSTAVRMRALFPDAHDLDAIFDRMRGHFVQTADALMGESRFEDALVAIRIIIEFEPDRAAHIAPVEHEILTAWADDQNRQARSQARAGRKGAASLMHARAYEIAGRPEDLQRARALAKQLADRERLRVDLRVTGATARATQIRDVLTTATAQLADVEQKSPATLTLRVSASGARCTEENQRTPFSKDYISGQIEVANPTHGQLTDRQAELAMSIAQATAGAVRLEPEVQRARHAIAAFDGQLATAHEALAHAEAQLAQAHEQVRQIHQTQAQIEAHLVELHAAGPGTEATVARRQAELSQLAGVLAQWQQAVGSAQAVVTHAHGVVQQIAIQRQPAADALARVQGGYDALVADLDSYRQLNIQTDQELALTSETLWQDVHETLDYEVFEWTRTCAAPVSVSMRAGWRTELPTSERYSPSVATQDSSHIGHELAQLTEDPKAYPDQDADLLARVDGATATEISAWLARMVEDYYETRTLETTMSMQKEPLRGADRLLGLYVGAPAHVDEATRLTFSSHARQHFGVERLELLRANDDGQVAHN